MLPGGQKKLDRVGHDVDWQRQVYEINGRIFRDFSKRQVVLEILARIQTACARDGRFRAAAKPDKSYSALFFQPPEGWNVSNASKPTATHQDNTDGCRHEEPRRSEEGGTARLNIQHLRRAEELIRRAQPVAPIVSAHRPSFDQRRLRPVTTELAHGLGISTH